jgi:chemotaxis regulatin CheY-phosphate phosphatase CheZ
MIANLRQGSEHKRAGSEHMPRPKDVADKATRESRSKGGQARAAKVRAEREEERRLLAESRRERVDVAIERLANAVEDAAATVIDLLSAESESVRLRAAEVLFEALDAAEIRELGDRLERLEALAATNGRKP